MIKGVFLIMGAVTVFTVMQSFIKAADGYPAGQSVFFRSFFALPIILVWLWMKHDLRDGLKTNNWKGHGMRGLVGTCAMACGFAGLKFLPLPDATALRFITPVMIVIFAALLLGEKIRLVRLGAVGVGLLGVLVIMWPKLEFDAGNLALLGVGLTLMSASLAALAQVFIKAMTATEKTAAIVFYFSMTASVLGLMTSPFGWVMPLGWDWALLIGAGLLGGVGQILMTSSYRFADASVIAPFTYVSILSAVFIGYVFFDELPTWQMAIGAGMIIAAGILIVWRERSLGLKRTAERKVLAQGK
ncbi:DMT family transporter [Algirhabdus cladophorae]|uniref:DMT family transporter n=1 Tax=Algirhabdus cladophorae TaxID=3377108 RepID=UPI003B849D63